MNNRPAIYDTRLSKDISVDSLVATFKSKGVTSIYYKLLSPNDNSKNQLYLAGHLTDLAFLPTSEITESKTTSSKNKNAKRQIKYTVSLDYSWLSTEGKVYPASNAKLIYYPQYPEVRLSGFVTRCGFDMGGWMDPSKKGREEGRVLFIGVLKSKEILAYLAVPDSRVAKEITDYPAVEISGVFKELRATGTPAIASSKVLLLQELKRIHLQNWIRSKRLNRDGAVMPYTAQNGGGYTLEAELGVIPNGYADPDFMGWEIKQFGVARCELINSKALTLMTPEPDAGFYAEHGAEAFMRKYGYESPSTLDRMDFTGRHFAGEQCEKSGLRLVIEGYDQESNVITDASGCIALLDSNGDAASAWTFSKVMQHWKRKHAKAAYIPSISRKEIDSTKSYSYCNNVRLFEGTTFNRLLQSMAESHVYYDPGIKLETASTNPKTKRRSQFRIKSNALSNLYEKQSDIDVLVD